MSGDRDNSPDSDSRTSVLFVCTGNICRSPLAEYLFREFVSRKGAGDGFHIGSAGTYALDGNPATREAIEAGRRWGLDLEPHRARLVTGDMLAATDHVLVMTRAHRELLLRQYPFFENKIYLAMLFPRHLSGEHPGRADVPDPIGESVGYYLRVLEMLEPVMPVIFQGTIEEDRS